MSSSQPASPPELPKDSHTHVLLTSDSEPKPVESWVHSATLVSVCLPSSIKPPSPHATKFHLVIRVGKTDFAVPVMPDEKGGFKPDAQFRGDTRFWISEPSPKVQFLDANGSSLIEDKEENYWSLHLRFDANTRERVERKSKNSSLVNAGKRWSQEEQNRMLSLAAEKKSHLEISKELKRTERAIKMRIQQVACSLKNEGKGDEEITRITGLEKDGIEEALKELARGKIAVLKSEKSS